MTNPRSLTVVQQVVDELTETTRPLRTTDRVPQDWPLDSLTTAELLGRIETRLQISLVDDPRTGGVHSVGDLCALLDDLTG